ncbi:hypothetical protein ACHAXA_000180 [Cyclostephanos tholiformis]|uniref:Cyclin C-terminal domain-containing protein n=1 Tax=Cyclostephanos tholiformis TaxID=382380 RepID=A0ABD3R1G1_9STRA
MTNNVYSQYHEGRIGGDIIGNLTRGCVIERLSIMRRQEDTIYNYRNCGRPPPTPTPPTPPAFSSSPVAVTNADNDESFMPPPLNSNWREKICHWSFNVIDHFDLSREVVAVSMSLFDRYLVTRGNRCNGSTALLASLTTLHIAIKVHEVRKIKLTTLANLSRGQFGPRHIEEMEYTVLSSLNWRIHPPTSMSFLSHLLLLLPERVSDSSKEEIYAMSRYITELSVCDSSFVDVNPSAVAYSAILNSFDDRRYRRLISSHVREQFFRAISTHVGLSQDDEHVLRARPKLRRLLIASLGTDNNATTVQEGGQHMHHQVDNQQQQQQQQQTRHHPHHRHQPAGQSSVAAASAVAGVTSSVGGIQISQQQQQDHSHSSSNTTNKMDDSISMSNSSRHSRQSLSCGSSYDSVDSRRRATLANSSGGGGGGGGGGGHGSRARVAPSPNSLMSTSPCSLSSRSALSVFSRHSRSPMTSLLPSS